MLAFLARHWKPLAVILLLIGVWLHGHATGADGANQRWKVITAKRESQHAKELAAAETHARQVEQGWAAAMDATAVMLVKENQNVLAHRDRLLAATRSGRLRLSSAGPTADVPEAASGAGGSDAAAGGRIPGPVGGAVVEALIGEAARADQIAAQLQACQGVLRDERRP